MAQRGWRIFGAVALLGMGSLTACVGGSRSAATAASPEPVARAIRSAPVTDVRYEVTADAATLRARSYDVAMRFRVAGPQPVLLSLPAWTPGSYTLENYARGVTGFAATQGGQPLAWGKRDPDTWRIVPAAAGTVEVRFRVRADAFDVSGSWARDDFGFFNGTNLLPFVEGYDAAPAALTVRTEPTWRVVTAMADGDSSWPGAFAFRAPNYHDLVDHPVFVGRFDVDSMLVSGKWMRLATWPVGSVSGVRRVALWDGLARVVDPVATVFGEVPWDRYTVLQAALPDFQGMSALEHSASELAVVGTPYLDEPFVLAVHAHEIVHAWNVKRLRPAELVPYRYDAWQPTPWLWVSEGLTDYYADLAQVRSGATDEAAFLETTLGKIESVESRPATALSDASYQSWLGMKDGTGDLYYDKGSLAGFALDILIRDASDNGRSLDDAMRELYAQTYRAGRGFTHDDVWNAVTRATGGRSWMDFERRYINGREAYPWREWLALAGWRLVTDTIAEPRLGVLLQEHPEGARVTEVDERGAAARAGVQVGDIITAIGGRSVMAPNFGTIWREWWGNREGRTVPVRVKRGHATLTLTATVEVLERVERRIEPDPNASAKARRIRAGILRG